MTSRISALGLGLLAAFCAYSQPALSTVYDHDRQIRLQGPITRIEWVNPRAYLFLDVRDKTGTIANWAVDFGSALELEQNGWKPSTLHVGDVVAVEGIPTRGDTRQVFARVVTLTPANKRLFTASVVHRTRAPEPAPRWPDGQIRLGSPPGRKGYWGTASTKALVENGAVRIAMNDDGLLLNLADADRVAPFQPWAKAVYEHRQRTLFQDDPLARCLPPGGPRQFQMPNGFQFVEQRELGRILVLLGGGDRNWRIIYTDGRPVGQGADAVLSYYGTSTGHWEKDTLVVEATGFNERFWMTNGGLPHTEALHLTERFTRTDGNTLKYEVTVDDPRTYTRPWTGGWTMQWIPDKDLEEYFCEDNVESTFNR